MRKLVVLSVLMLSACGGSPVAPTPPPSSQPAEGGSAATPVALSCTVSGVVSAEGSGPTVSFDEQEVVASWDSRYAEGTYATCPMMYSRTMSSFTVKGVSFNGNFSFRNLWNGCASNQPQIWEAGVLQSSDSVLNITVPSTPAPKSVRLSLGIDGSFPEARFDLTATTTSGETAMASAFTSLGRVNVTCNKQIASLRIVHNGPYWILDSLAY